MFLQQQPISSQAKLGLAFHCRRQMVERDQLASETLRCLVLSLHVEMRLRQGAAGVHRQGFSMAYHDHGSGRPPSTDDDRG